MRPAFDLWLLHPVSSLGMDATGIYGFILELIQKEKEAHKVKVKQSLRRIGRYKLNTAKDRIRYLYNTGTVRIAYVEECFKLFMSSSAYAKDFARQLLASSRVTVLSVSDVPCLDCIGFLMFLKCFLKSEKLTVGSVLRKLTIVNTYKEWKPTIASALANLAKSQYLDFLESDLTKNIELVVGNPLTCPLQQSKEVTNAIYESDIILLTDIPYDKEHFQSGLQNFLSEMKVGGILFYISGSCTAENVIKEIQQASGDFLLDPSEYRFEIKIDTEKTKFRYGYRPQLAARATFFVWQKSSDTEVKESYAPGNLAVNMNTLESTEKSPGDFPSRIRPPLSQFRGGIDAPDTTEKKRERSAMPSFTPLIPKHSLNHTLEFELSDLNKGDITPYGKSSSYK